MSLKLDKRQYIKWQVYSVTTIKKGYGFRIKLSYEDDSYDLLQRSGFKTKKEAKEQRDIVIAQLYAGTFVVYPNIKVEEFFLYWLEEVMCKKEGFSYNSYMSYRNAICNYILKEYGRLKMTTLNPTHVQKLYNKVAAISESVAETVKTVMNTALNYAKYKQVVSCNVALDVNLPKTVKKEPYRVLEIDSSKTLSIEQIKILLEAAKKTPIYLQIMFAVLMGMRISEINGLKYSNIDFINRRLHVEEQLGRDLKKDKTECQKKTFTKQRVKLKTKNSQRWLDIPDILFEAILEQRVIYEKNRKRRINDKTCPFTDDDYICCSTYGRSRSRGFHQGYYKQLLKENNLPDIRFHDLRHTYTTILLNANFDVKAVSKLLGHGSEIITVNVYCDTDEIIYDCLDVLEPFIESVIPKKDTGDCIFDYTNLEIDKYFDKFYNSLCIV